ncbi:porin [Azoarcus sp. CIB]|uniref:porin n=1 Tax=Aromatoleum sp. (strain CIB) TaxID=198107 RepID=UPI00067AE383|nr:porin [Azoarcus sp. CIB]AKU12627.1 porin [Azoarcus sp. CIB]
MKGFRIVAGFAALGVVAGPVFAQSNVTIYGAMDMFVGQARGEHKSLTVVDSGGLEPSRIGFHGTEDLGNGLKALFRLESGIAADTGGTVPPGVLFSRQSFVGLQGGFGTVTAGRQHSPGYWMSLLRYDALMGGPFSPVTALAAQGSMSVVSTGPGRVNNSINYNSPNWGGLTVSAMYGVGQESTVNRNAGEFAGASINYANGPLSVGYVFHRLDTSTVAAPIVDRRQREHMLGASYDFKVVKVIGSYQTLDGDVAAEARLWNLGARIPVGAAGNVQVAYAAYRSDASQSDSRSWALGYSHDLSKRTALYGRVIRADNDDAVARSVYNGLAERGGATRLIGVGMRHSF